MLQHLSIENYTIIQHLSISFKDGFSVISGETGAGKSILIGALSLVLGQRADTNILRTKDKKSIVEAVFDIEDLNLKKFFEDNDIDYDTNCILRRELTPQGKSRAFINDTPVSLNTLRILSEHLVDIHSQHSHLLMQSSGFQLNIIDQFANLQNELLKYNKLYNKYISARKDYDILIETNKFTDYDYFEFLHKELKTAAIHEGEQKDLEEELETLNHAEEIKQNLYSSYQQLSGNEISILTSLRDIQYRIANVAKFKTSLCETEKRLESSLIELEDIASELNGEQDKITYNPGRIEEIQNRLNLIYTLQQKHRVNDEKQLLQKQLEIEYKLKTFVESAEKEAQYKALITSLEKDLIIEAESLHKKRVNVIPEIENALSLQLNNMNIPDAKISICLQRTNLNHKGNDNAEIWFSANAGCELQPLTKIASGGEISRIMLAIKALISQKNMLPTIILDEIDNGVSGKVSAKMANVMKKIANYCQLIAISHQAQIASKAQHHYDVYKTVRNGQTFSEIKLLEGEERVQSIAKMISNENITEASLQMARSLISG